MATANNLIDKKYFKDHHLFIYLEDAVAQMLSKRQNGEESPYMTPAKFFKEYFTSVHQGTCVLFREFSFISATPHNRLCVLKALLQVYKPFLHHEEYRFNAKECHEIVKLIFPDFHMQVIQDAFAKFDNGKEKEEKCIKFVDFLMAVKDSFCKGEFDAESAIVHKQLEDQINEFSTIPAQSGKTARKLTEADLLKMQDNTFGKQAAFSSKILDGSELKRILNLNDSVFDDKPASGGKLSRFSEESKEALETGKTKSEIEEKTGDRLSYNHLSDSLNLLQSGKERYTKRGKRRHRSKSAVSIQRTLKPWR